MLSPVYFSAVIMLTALPSVWGQCTTSRCQDKAYEPPRWENGAVYLEALLTKTSERILKAVERRHDELTATIERRLEALEERIRHDIQTVANTTEIQLKEVQTQANVTVEVIHEVEASLTALCSSPVPDPLLSAINSSSNAQLQILRLLESRDQGTFLRRVDGSVNFTRDWAGYKSGFGDVNGEFWLGLETLHQLTTQESYGLRVDMEDFSGERKWASYQSFRVGSESGNYVLTVTGYNADSTAGDSMDYHNGMKFSTYDRDNDRHGASGYNCAARNKGGWWYKHCHHCNPTGLYKPAGYRGFDGITWVHAYGDRRSFKSMSLKLVGN